MCCLVLILLRCVSSPPFLSKSPPAKITRKRILTTLAPQAIYALISPLIQPHAAEPGTYGLPCTLIPTLPASISLTFTSTANEPFNLTIPSSELSVGPFADDATVCQTLINAFDGLELVGGELVEALLYGL